jgi:hypothetical protein
MAGGPREGRAFRERHVPREEGQGSIDHHLRIVRAGRQKRCRCKASEDGDALTGQVRLRRRSSSHEKNRTRGNPKAAKRSLRRAINHILKPRVISGWHGNFLGFYGPAQRSVRGCGSPMPEASHYLHQAGVILSLSFGTSNPIVAAKLREIAEEYLARAVKLRVDRGLPPLPRTAALPARPYGPRYR